MSAAAKVSPFDDPAVLEEAAAIFRAARARRLAAEAAARQTAKEAS